MNKKIPFYLVITATVCLFGQPTFGAWGIDHCKETKIQPLKEEVPVTLQFVPRPLRASTSREGLVRGGSIVLSAQSSELENVSLQNQSRELNAASVRQFIDDLEPSSNLSFTTSTEPVSFVNFVKLAQLSGRGIYSALASLEFVETTCDGAQSSRPTIVHLSYRFSKFHQIKKKPSGLVPMPQKSF